MLLGLNADGSKSPALARTQSPAEAFLSRGKAAEEPERELEVWREHWPSVRLFDGMATQWRWAEGRRVGMDYTALPVVARLVGIPAAERAQAFSGLRTMEDEARRLWAERAQRVST